VFIISSTTEEYDKTTSNTTEITTSKPDLSPGAIAAITTASVAMVGIGGLICCKLT
jgi:hypothetical protein